jgi:hypothetical protein
LGHFGSESFYVPCLDETLLNSSEYNIVDVIKLFNTYFRFAYLLSDIARVIIGAYDLWRQKS